MLDGTRILKTLHLQNICFGDQCKFTSLMGRIWILNETFTYLHFMDFSVEIYLTFFFPCEKLCFFMVPVAPRCYHIITPKQGLLSTFSAMAGGWGQPRWFHENERKNLPPWKVGTHFKRDMDMDLIFQALIFRKISLFCRGGGGMAKL